MRWAHAATMRTFYTRLPLRHDKRRRHLKCRHDPDSLLDFATHPHHPTASNPLLPLIEVELVSANLINKTQLLVEVIDARQGSIGVLAMTSGLRARSLERAAGTQQGARKGTGGRLGGQGGPLRSHGWLWLAVHN